MLTLEVDLTQVMAWNVVPEMLVWDLIVVLELVLKIDILLVQQILRHVFGMVAGGRRTVHWSCLVTKTLLLLLLLKLYLLLVDPVKLL